MKSLRYIALASILGLCGCSQKDTRESITGWWRPTDEFIEQKRIERKERQSGYRHLTAPRFAYEIIQENDEFYVSLLMDGETVSPKVCRIELKEGKLIAEPTKPGIGTEFEIIYIDDQNIQLRTNGHLMPLTQKEYIQSERDNG